jgi:hypothetical protein
VRVDAPWFVGCDKLAPHCWELVRIVDASAGTPVESTVFGAHRLSSKHRRAKSPPRSTDQGAMVCRRSLRDLVTPYEGISLREISAANRRAGRIGVPSVAIATLSHPTS